MFKLLFFKATKKTLGPDFWISIFGGRLVIDCICTFESKYYFVLILFYIGYGSPGLYNCMCVSEQFKDDAPHRMQSLLPITTMFVVLPLPFFCRDIQKENTLVKTREDVWRRCERKKKHFSTRSSKLGNMAAANLATFCHFQPPTKKRTYFCLSNLGFSYRVLC